MTAVGLPLGDQTLSLDLPDATLDSLFPTPPATLAETQQAVGAWLAATLAAVGTRLNDRLPPKPGKKSGPRAVARVMILVADDSRRVGYDPWISELADGLVQAGLEENRVEFFIAGQLDDPPLGLRMIRQLGEDACGRFAAECHRADREDDHDPEQDGLDLTALRDRTLFVAARPVFEAPHWTNALGSFLGRGLLARPLCEIVQHAAVEAFLKTQEAGQTKVDPLRALLALEAGGFGELLQARLPMVIDAPFAVDGRGEMVSAHASAKPLTDPVAAVLTAAGATPNDLWFDNLLTAGAAAVSGLQPGGSLVIAGQADEGLPFAEWREVLTAFQTTRRETAWTTAVGEVRARTESAPALRYAILQLGTILQTASSVTFLSPGLVPEADDDESERPRREIPPGPRLCAAADPAAAALPPGLCVRLP